MGVSRTELFTEEQNEIAALAKMFSHPARVAIIQILLKTNSCINGDLVEEIGLAQATISQHLRELKEVGIIMGTIEGTKINYCINAEKWEEIKNKFNLIFDRYQPSGSNECC